MAVPGSRDARRFYRCAFQRFREAEVLLAAGYTTGAVYLAGYAVECILKVLVLESAPTGTRRRTLESFRGNRGHDYEWLRSQYLTNGGARFPHEAMRHFTLVNVWSTDLRYTPRMVRPTEAKAFLTSARILVRWADGRL